MKTWAWALALLVASAVVWSARGEADTSWFLSEDELDAAMSGFARAKTGLHTFSMNNTVTPLMNGNVFMADLYDNIIQAGPGDFIHACMWDVNMDMLLKPDHTNPEASKKTKLETVLLDAIERGVDVRLLISANQYQIPIATCRTFNPKCKEKFRDCCAPDIRHPHNLIGSMHVKMWTLTRKGELLAYIGGMDVSYNRWDTWDHDPNNPDRLMQPQHIVLRSPWHDHHVRVQGDGAYDLERTFWQRWSDKVTPYTFYDLKPYPFNAPVTSNGVEAVQVVRTFGCQGAGGKDGFYKDFAPHGDYSYQALFLKAVSRAKRYIYVEDQFMTYPVCHKALADALPHVDFVVIATNIGSEEVDSFVSFNLSEWQDTIQHYQYEAFKVLMGSPKVHVFVMGLPGKPLSASDQIYNHAKTLIVDDEFILTGSCGVERAGWTNDHEMSVGIVTPGVAGPDSFAGRFRRKLWGEWLSIRDENDPVLQDPKTALDALVRQADAGNMRPRHYWPQDNPHFYSKWIYEVLEPDGRCDAATTGIPDEMLISRARTEASFFNSPHHIPEKWVD